MEKSIFSATIVAALGFQTAFVEGQSPAFTLQTQCPQDDTLTGYTSILDLNNDMAAELQRVTGENAEDPPETGYNLILCPGTFDVTEGNFIQPVIDQVTISCGGPDSAEPECIIDGGREQLVIQNPTVDSYELTSVAIEGVTFNNFRRGSSATLTANEPTVFTCRDCIWQNFDDSDFAVDLRGSMTFRVESGIIRTPEENSGRSNVNEAVIDVNGGNLEVEGLLVDGVDAATDIIRGGNNGRISLSGATIRDSSVARNILRVDSGTTASVNNVEVESNIGLDIAFSVQLPESLLQISNTRISNNLLDTPWSGVSAFQGGRVEILDSLFQGNEGLQFGVSSQGNAGSLSSINIERTNFVENVSFGPSSEGPSALVATLGNGVGNPTLTLRRVEFQGNNGFVGNFMTLRGGSLTIRQACFLSSSNLLVGFQGQDGEDITFSDNFIAQDEQSFGGCTAENLRLGVEQGSGGCFTPAETSCQVACQGIIADSAVCLSQVEFTDSPTISPAPSFFSSRSPSMPPSLEESVLPSVEQIIVSESPTESPTIEDTLIVVRPPVFRPGCFGKGNGKGFCEPRKRRKRKPIQNKPVKGVQFPQKEYLKRLTKPKINNVKNTKDVNNIKNVKKIKKASKSSKSAKKPKGQGHKIPIGRGWETPSRDDRFDNIPSVFTRPIRGSS